MNVLFLGLVCWFATTLIVEAEITAPIRAFGDATVDRLMMSGHRRLGRVADKLNYLLHCHMCCGTWVGLALAFTFGGPFSGFPGWIASGLLYKAIGHLVLELRPQSWYVTPHPEIDIESYLTSLAAPPHLMAASAPTTPNHVDGQDQWCCGS